MKYILFISHDASRTGAPVLLLHFLRWFKLNTKYSFVVVLRQDGVLREEFEKLAPVIVYKPKLKFKPTPINKFKSRFIYGKKTKQPLAHRLEPYTIGAIFSNTLTNGQILQELAYLKVPIISYSHELTYTLAVEYGGPYLEYTIRNTNFFLTGSEAVRQNLLSNYQVVPENTKVAYSFLPPQHFVSSLTADESVALKKSMQLKPDSFIIGGIGAGAWRKGVDLFLLLAKKLTKGKPEHSYHFIWIGVGSQLVEFDMLNHDIEKADMTSFVHLLPSKANYRDYLQLFDIFVLPSREDPYPLIVLEAALMEKPIVCFDKAGGVPEFVREDAGFKVPYLDIDAFEEAIYTIQTDPGRTKQTIKTAKERVATMHDVEIIAPDIVKVINKYL